MATFFTDFSEYTVGQAPNDWTESVGASAFHATIENDDDGNGNHIHTTYDSLSTTQRILSWDAVGSVTDVEVVAKLRAASATSGAQACVWVRAAAGVSYSLELYGGTNAVVRKIVSGGAGSHLSDIPFSWDRSGPYYGLRLRVVGSTIQARVWEWGQTEPTTWDVTLTDTSVSGAGLVGVGNVTPGNQDFALFGVGTDGDTAPTSASSTGTSVTGSASLAASGTLTASGVVTTHAKGAASLSASTTLTATGTRGVTGAASLAASGTLAVAGRRGVFGAASLAATGTLTATGSSSTASTGAVSLSASTSLSVSGVRGRSGAASLAATSALSAGGTRGVYGRSALAAEATLTAAGKRGRYGSAALSADGALTAAGRIGKYASVSMSATTSLSANGFGRDAARRRVSRTGRNHARVLASGRNRARVLSGGKNGVS